MVSHVLGLMLILALPRVPFSSMTIFKFASTISVSKLFADDTSMSTSSQREVLCNIGVLRICDLNNIFRNVWSKSKKNTCEEVNF